MASEPDLELSFANGFDAQTFKEIAVDLGVGGAQVSLRRRPPQGPYAFLEWLIPTGVFLWIVKPYVQQFSKETGKLHAQGLHNALSKLWNKVFGPNPEITYTIAGTSGKVGPEVFSHAVSVKMARNDGGEVTLLFPPATSSEDFSLAVARFMDLMENHYTIDGADRLTKAMGLVPYLKHPYYQALVFMNPESGNLELIDYIESSRLRQLITHRIE